MPRELWLVVVGLYLVMSLVTFAVFAIDKRAAKRGTWRTPEKTLMSLSLCCGWPGALLAMKLVRHKTRHKLFTIGVPAIACLHIAAWIALALVVFGNTPA
jgi:uncharacterized membrane protein YsdA (DUF1294 family)